MTHWVGLVAYTAVATCLLPGTLVDWRVRQWTAPTATVLLLAWGYAEIVARFGPTNFPVAFYVAADALCYLVFHGELN